MVEDTLQALGQLAACFRRSFSLPVVAVAGSNGKTTTKDLLASVLEQKFPTLRSAGSFNNDIGVPLTLLGLEQSHRAAVLEAGTNHPGQLAPLLRMIAPRLGVLTCIGREHLEFFGSVEGVAQEEGWVAELLPADGVFLANGDCRWTSAIARRTRAGVVRVGLTEANDWRATDLRPDSQGVAFHVEGPQVGCPEIPHQPDRPAPGPQRPPGAGRRRGVRPDADRDRPGPVPLQAAPDAAPLWEHNGVSVLDDAYNANADSMLRALETLRELPCKGRRVAVLGDMAELGPHSEAAHEEVGRRAAELGIGQLFAVARWRRWWRAARGAPA